MAMARTQGIAAAAQNSDQMLRTREEGGGREGASVCWWNDVPVSLLVSYDTGVSDATGCEAGGDRIVSSHSVVHSDALPKLIPRNSPRTSATTNVTACMMFLLTSSIA
eukprot:TRINITY_DN81602_c0_g1_i1.p1 TRINITY_DN81602_c0_g1~~TRINITY_DN81602_c0_g1_i1.p1  ORF type:complete len:117 (+),score=11.80 TRINITY_DN81602_c0_g1_i1:30-353(+)